MRKYTREILEDAVSKSISYSDVCRVLGLAKAGGSSYELIKNRIAEYNIDIKHFLGKGAFSGKRNPNYSKRRKVDEIFVDGYQYRASHKLLKRGLLEMGVKYECNNCKLNEWLGKKITLDIDHVNGNWKDCRIENVRFLCPNCHRQTETFGGKNKK